MKSALELVVQLCDATVAEHLARAKMPAWHWGPALFGYGLCELDRVLGEGRYRPWLTRYLDQHLSHPPRVDQSDAVPPGLVAYATWHSTGRPEYRALAELVADYVRSAPRTVGGAPNHLGTSAVARLYPRSAWVDSLMMFTVFAARYGRDTRQGDLVQLAAEQPGVFADLLFDPRDALWAHSWWERTGRPYPGRGVYWARGSAWVIAALPMILDDIGDHPEAPRILDLLRRTSAALLEEQRPDGAWNTLLRDSGRSYRELSATALIASGWLQATSRGWLDRRYREPARSALNAVVSSLQLIDGRWVMPETSGPTIPLPLAPRLGYRVVPRGGNRDYGIAGLILAAINDWRAF